MSFVLTGQANRLSAILADLWETLADTSAVTEDKPRVMFFPDCPAVSDARGLQSLYEHLEVSECLLQGLIRGHHP